MSDETVTSFREGRAACPFIAFEDDRDHRADHPDYRHRCFAAADAAGEPRALPHQERFCLSAAFAQCPIFLDWARQEAAGVADKNAATASTDEPAAAPVTASAGAPAFLASRGRTTPAEATSAGTHSSDPGSGLWGFEGAPKRTITPVTAPASSPESTAPAVAMARRQPSRPAWENPPRMDNYPRLRSRDDRNNNQPLLLAAVGVAVLFAALILYPLLGGNNGGGAKSTASSSAVAADGSAATAAITDSPTPEATPTFQIYHVKSGDNMQVIANKYGITLEQLLAANPQIKNANYIQVGQTIYIPWQTWVPPTAPPTPTPTPSPTPTPPPTPKPTPTPKATPSSTPIF
ncbi:MAG: LysM peptidoglycan-binding domain-containing protein [Candidatus Limnocylindrales bacterium]|jgi:LysM repeat protein